MMWRSVCYSFDLLENSDSSCRASIMLPATFNRPDANAYKKNNTVDEYMRAFLAEAWLERKR